MPSQWWKDLLPGIHDDITVTHIVTKLPWKTLHVLSSVSPAWQRAIQSREVYGERIRSQSTETLVVLRRFGVQEQYGSSIALYSMREKVLYQLPPIPQLESGISKYSQFISVDGKLYVLGAGSASQHEFDSRGHIYFKGLDRSLDPFEFKRRAVYMLDLAGQRQWEECINVQEPEREYTVSIGGGLQVQYWSNDGIIEGYEHFVYGGSADWFRSFWQKCDAAIENVRQEEGQDWRGVRLGRSLYGDPNERSPVSVFGVQEEEYDDVKDSTNFMVQGKYYSIHCRFGEEKHDICFYDMKKKSWIHQHVISCSGEMELEFKSAVDPRRWSLSIDPYFILPLNNELLAVARWERLDNQVCWHYDGGVACLHFEEGHCLLQTKGFGSDSKEIVWEMPHQSLDLLFGENVNSWAICPIQL